MTRLALLLIFAIAKPGYRYEFPRDHFSHPEFRTEWWYWTGNLRTSAGRRFGFELTFFRQAVSEERTPANPWDPTDLYLAHFTLSDIATGRFHHFERLHRAGPGIAGADAVSGRIWNGNWVATLNSLRAITPEVGLDLHLSTNKPPVIHGVDGISRKAEGAGRASHYISFTRLLTDGKIAIEGETFTVEGTSWMDHEFFSNQLTPEQIGWDWFSVQLDDGSELMLVRLRRRDGSSDPYSSGTYIDATGKSRHLSASDFSLTPEDIRWTSAESHATYPLRWRLRVPSLNMDLAATTPMSNQELVSKTNYSPTYWEGAVDYSGTSRGRQAHGVGYLEMTGYAAPVSFGVN